MPKLALTDRTYLFLLFLGPLFWLSYYIYAPQPRLEWAWPARQPLPFVLLAFVYPVLEEVVFRGLILEWFSRKLPQRLGIVTLANVLTSLLFAALHLIHQAIGWSLLIVFPSLVFGYARERYRTLWAPILLHVWYNLGFIWLFRPISQA